MHEHRIYMTQYTLSRDVVHLLCSPPQMGARSLDPASLPGDRNKRVTLPHSV